MFSVFIYNTIFFFAYYPMREVEDHFKITKELRVTITTLFITDFLYCGCLLWFYTSAFVILGFVEYIQVALNLILLYITAFKPVRQSYKTNFIVPFPINDEMISELNSAMLMPISSKYFHDYLENELDDMQALSLFSLYVDLRIFYNMLGDSNTKYKALKEQAKTIFNDYVVPNCVYDIPQNEIIRDLRSGFVNGEITFDVNADLFLDMQDFANSGLTVFYQLFMKSEKFTELKEEVHRQEVLYYVLHKYQLISN